MKRAALMLVFAAAPVLAALPDEDLRRGFLNLIYIEDLSYRLGYEQAVHGTMTLPAQPVLDPWGTPYRIGIEGGKLRIIGAGADRRFQPETWSEEGQFADLFMDVVFHARWIRSNHRALKEVVRDGAMQGQAVNEALAANRGKPLDQVLATPQLAAGYLVSLEEQALLLGSPVSLDILRAEKTAATMKQFGEQLTKETSVRYADEWGTPLRVEFEADDSFRIVSAGADRKFDPESWSQPVNADPGGDQVYVSGRGMVREFDRYEFTRRRVIESAARIEARASSPAAAGPRTVERAGLTAYVAGGEVEWPVITKKVGVKYPREMRKKKKIGLLTAELLVDETGKLRDVTVVASPDPAFDRVTKEAVAKWTFLPGKYNGKPVPVLARMTIDFGSGGK